MNCADFKIWLVDKDVHDQSRDQEAKLHRLSCSRCEKLYTLDQMVEQRLAKAFLEVDPPADFVTRIKTAGRYAEIDEPGPAVRWKLLGAALATAAIFFMVFLNPFSGKIRNMGEIGSLVLANHLNNNMKMAFKAGQVDDVSAWFAKKIGFPITMPDMAGQGFTFLGGRPCALGHKKAAYLMYEKEGKKCSLFVINADDLAFKLEKDKNYSIKENDHRIKLWSEPDLVYAMVI